MHPKSHPPQDRPEERRRAVAKKGERGEEGGHRRERDEHHDAAAVKEPAEEQRAEPAGAHCHRVEDRHQLVRHRARLFEVERHQREVGESRAHEPGAGDVEPEGVRQPLSTNVCLAGRDPARIGIGHAGERQGGERDDRGNGQDAERELVVTA